MRRFLRLPHALAAAATVVASAAGASAPVQPLRWHLATNGGPLDRAIDRVVDGVSARAADPLVAVAAATGAVRTAAVRVAPMVSNILNSRRVTTLEEVGAPGSGEGYLRGLRRTIGVTLRKPIF